MTANDILYRLHVLNDYLQRNETYLTMDIYGGAAVALCYDSRRTTEDIDCILQASSERIKPLLAEFNRINGFEKGWINQAVSVFVPKCRNVGSELLALSNLRVNVCSPELLLAMKCRALRTTDLADIKLLLQVTEVNSVSQIVKNNDYFFPTRPLPLESLSILMSLLN